MKKLLLINLFAITFFSCKKDTEPYSINAPFNSSNSTIQYKFNYTIPSDFTKFIPCTNEWVNFTGELVGRLHSAETIDGPRLHAHYTNQSHYQNMQGIGLTSGNKYTFISQRIDVANFSEGETTVGRITDRLRVTAAGGGNNFEMVIVVRLVISGTGEIIISDQEEKVYCQ